MEFGVLGPLEATMDGVEVRIAAPKQRALLAVLVLHANQMVSSDRLLDLVWGDTDGGVGKLRFQISKLRDALEPDRNGNDSTVLVTESPGYRLVADPNNVDIVRFERLAAEAHERTAADAGATLTLTDKALGLWRGPALGEFEYDEWAQPAIRHLNELRLAVVEDRLDALLALGRARDVVAQAQALVTDHPLSERFRAQHMVALYRTGRHAEALRAYERTRTYLVEETGLDPSPELQRLEQQILNHDASLMLEDAPAAQHAAILVADVAEPQLLSSLGSSERQELLNRQSGTLDRAVRDHGGRVFAHRGSAMFAAFDAVERAATTAASVQQALNGDHRGMRMAIDVGNMRVPGNGHLEDPAIVRAVRLAARAHGGQVLVSDDAMKALSDPEGTSWTVRALARQEMDGAGDEGSLHQLVVDGLPDGFPPLRSDAAPPPLPIDVRGLPGYELREEIGAGAFGVVHRAYQPSVGREVAIKTIRPEYANEPGFIR
ncbi:MAG: BTAD domain-containing putative transcriptional regulator, partial [Actinomycetota bacterium]